MGMYTELHFNAELRKDTPSEVIELLRWMARTGTDLKRRPETPEHPFFACPRWPVLFTMDSYYFDADTHSTLRYDDIAERYYLCVRSNLKNYDDEIEKFIDWIDLWLAKEPGDFLGFYRYEETEHPTLIYKRPPSEEER